jgi:hypothetical protein
MQRLIRAAALTLALQQAAAVTAAVAAQGKEGSGAIAPACPLVTEKEIEAATGLDYRLGKEIEQEYEWIDGGETCMWGGPSMVHEDLPEITVTVIAAGARGSHTERRHKQGPQKECTRESVPGVGDRAFADICEGSLQSASVFARMGNSDVVVRVYQQEGKVPLAYAPKPVAIVIAKAAAARATGK